MPRLRPSAELFPGESRKLLIIQTSFRTRAGEERSRRARAVPGLFSACPPDGARVACLPRQAGVSAPRQGRKTEPGAARMLTVTENSPKIMFPPGGPPRSCVFFRIFAPFAASAAAPVAGRPGSPANHPALYEETAAHPRPVPPAGRRSRARAERGLCSLYRQV